MLVAGIDIGSTTTKIALLQDSKFAGSAICPTGADIDAACNIVLKSALDSISMTQRDINYIVTTGYGRRGVSFGDETITEISANARGAILINQGVRTIIDVGGQDTKVISLDATGVIQKFLMNDKCAAGTGRFIEVISRVLQEDLDNFSRKSLLSKEPVTINSTCTVFAESEVISLIAQKMKKEDIIAGINRSIAKRISELAKQVGITPIVFFDGGGAKNIGLKKELERLLGCSIVVPEIPEIVVAYGAAAIAREKCYSKNK